MSEEKPLKPASESVPAPAISGIVSRNLAEVEDDAVEENSEAPLDKFFRQQLENLSESLLWEGIKELEDLDFPAKAQIMQTLNDVATSLYNCKGTHMASYAALSMEKSRDHLEDYLAQPGSHDLVKYVCQLALNYCEKLDQVAITPEYAQLMGVSGNIKVIKAKIRGIGNSPHIEIVISPLLVKKIEACEEALRLMDAALYKSHDFDAALKKFIELAEQMLNDVSEPEKIALKNSQFSHKFKVILETFDLFFHQKIG